MQPLAFAAIDRRTGLPPFWLPMLAGLPVVLCMAVMALPVLGNGNAFAYRALYLSAFMLWSLPLAWLQRALWQRLPWWLLALALLLVTYLMSLATNGLGLALGYWAGWEAAQPFSVIMLLRGRGLDGCWLALVAFCAIHAVVNAYAALRDAQVRQASALALARDAQLHALRLQLQPHFLFNTLNAISALVAAQRAGEARQMLSRLGDFLRAVLDGGQAHEVELAEELALTETYLAIEKARLGERLQLEWNIGPDLLDARVPHLLLQPLVENAIRHGIAPRRQPGRLQIVLQREQDQLLIAIDNDGAAGATAAAAQRPALGLNNTSARLQQLYPGAHRLSAQPRADGGYSVRIALPWRRMTAPEALP